MKNLKYKKALVFSKGIMKIPYLNTFLYEFHIQKNNILTKTKKVDSIIGWGRKPTANRAYKYSNKHNIPFICIEDGFIRSYLPGQKYPPLSLIMDSIGIYYDATRPSDLENMLNDPKFCCESIINNKYYNHNDAQLAIDIIIKNKISKYAYLKDINNSFFDKLPKNKKKILIVDQTVGDASIEYSMSNKDTFNKMLETAKKNNPDAIFIIKSHPEVALKIKSGHFSKELESDNVKIIYDSINPYSIFEYIDEVYVVSSTLGFEALLAGKTVHCFGIPWYSNWGVTIDYCRCPRRTQKRTTLELFFAGYLQYTRYLNPITKELGSIFDVLDWLILQKNITSHYTGKIIALGFKKWKQFNVSELLSFHSDKLLFFKNINELIKENISLNQDDVFIVWGNHISPDLALFAKKNSIRILRMEDGFIRSVGLGSDLIPPSSFVLDQQGLYFDPSQLSDLEELLSTKKVSSLEKEKATKLKILINDFNITKYNVDSIKKPAWLSLKKNKKVILVPGQVEDDASILFGSPKINSNLSLLREVRLNERDAYIVYKPHPDVLAKNRKGRVNLSQAYSIADYIEQDISIISCIKYCDEVHTMTSLSGFDALIRDKKVVTYGMPFYAGWGLTIDKESNPKRNRKLELKELISISLTSYPIYWDDTLKGYTNCEATIYKLINQKENKKSRFPYLRYIKRQLKKLAILVKAFIH